MNTAKIVTVTITGDDGYSFDATCLINNAIGLESVDLVRICMSANDIKPGEGKLNGWTIVSEFPVIDAENPQA